jgi:NADPH:quinone reductase
MKAIRVSETGGPDALEYVDVDPPEPGPGEAVITMEAIGVNFLDVYHRSGLYPMPAPFTPGSEGAGVVEQVGPGVGEVTPGDRVVFSHIGSYAERVVVPAGKLVRIPDGIETRTAAACFLQGATAHYLTTSTYPLRGGQKVLVHAGAGGVGGILVQMAKQRGTFVFATASTDKLDIARAAGADVVIDYTAADFHAEVMRHTEGPGLDVVYDSVGRTTFDGSLASLKVRGTLVVFGQSSGPVPPVDLLRLARKSLYLTRPTLAHYIDDREELLWRANDLFEAVGRGAVRIRIQAEIPLADAAGAHRLLEGRATTGKLLLIP